MVEYNIEEEKEKSMKFALKWQKNIGSKCWLWKWKLSLLSIASLHPLELSITHDTKVNNLNISYAEVVSDKAAINCIGTCKKRATITCNIFERLE